MSFQIIINPNNQGPPYFEDTLISSITIKAPDKYYLALPGISDDDGDNYALSTSFGAASGFVSLNDKVLEI